MCIGIPAPADAASHVVGVRSELFVSFFEMHFLDSPDFSN